MTLLASLQVQRYQLIDKRTTVSVAQRLLLVVWRESSNFCSVLQHHDVGLNPGIQSDFETDMIPIPRRQLLSNPIGCATPLSTAQRAPGYHASYPSTLHSTHAPLLNQHPSPTRKHTSPTNPDNRCRIHLLPRAAFPPRHPQHGPLDEHRQPLEPF